MSVYRREGTSQLWVVDKHRGNGTSQAPAMSLYLKTCFPVSFSFSNLCSFSEVAYLRPFVNCMCKLHAQEGVSGLCVSVSVKISPHGPSAPQMTLPSSLPKHHIAGAPLLCSFCLVRPMAPSLWDRDEWKKGNTGAWVSYPPCSLPAGAPWLWTSSLPYWTLLRLDRFP